MRWVRWLVLVPACLGLLYLFFVATVATHYLAEQNLCPAAAFDRGICNHAGMTWALKTWLHVSMALAVLAVGCAAAWIAPTAKRRVRWVTLAVLVLAAGWFGYAGHAWSLAAAALLGAGICALAGSRFMARKAHEALPAPDGP